MTLPPGYVSGLSGQAAFLAGYDRPIASVARLILERIVAMYEENDTPLPARRLITIGSVAVDDELVAVMFGGVSVGPPGNELNQPLRQEQPRSMVYNVELWRDTPSITESGTAPQPQEIQDASEIIMHDAWLLLEAAYTADMTGVGIIANVTVLEPQGQLHGVAMNLELQVP